MRGLGIGQTVVLLEDGRQFLDRLRAPSAQDSVVKAVLGGQLAERLGLFEQLQHQPGFEGRGVSLFQTAILPNPSTLKRNCGASARLIMTA
jgi:hypothetical protein